MISGINNKGRFRTIAPNFRSFNNRDLKAVVIDNELFMDFSPYFLSLYIYSIEILDHPKIE
jgi:hypothetical protein